MTDETLRMAAEIVDKWSPALKNMQRSLRSLSDQMKGSHKAGVDQVNAHTKAYDGLHRSVREVSERVRGALAPAMATFGISALSAAGGIAAVAKAAKEFGGSAQHFSDLSKEVGLSVQQLRVWEALAERVGSSAEAMDSGLQGFGAAMEQMRRNKGELSVWMQSSIPQVAAIGHAMHDTTDNATALAMAMKLLGAIPDPQQKRYFLEQLHLPLELATKSAKELADWYDELDRKIKPLTKEQIEQGKQSKLAVDRMRESYRELKEQIGAGLAPAITRMTDALRHFVEANQDGLIKVLKDVAVDIESADWQGFADAIKSAAEQVNGVAQAVGGWKNLMEGLVAVKVMAWLAPIVTAVGVLAGGLSRITSLRAALGAGVVGGLGAMKQDSETGNHARTWLRKKMGIEDPGEPAPWMPGGQFETDGPSLGQLLNPNRRTGNAATWHSRMRGLIPFHASEGGGEKPEETIRKGVKEGFLDGLREGFHRESFTGDGFGGGAGVIKASYGGGGFGGGLGGGSGAARGAPMGALGGGGAGAGGGVDAVRRALGGSGGGDDPSLTGNAYLKSQRAALMAEVNQDPATKHLLHQMMATEGGGAPTVEALFNRTAMIRKKIPGYGIKDELNSGFYGPIKRGEAQRRSISAGQAARDQKILDEVGGGSDHIKSRTDQGMVGDPNWQGPGRVKIPGSSEIYNFWHGRRRGIDFGSGDSQRFADEQEGHVNASITAAHKNAFIAAARAARSRMPRGDQSSSSDIHAGLLDSARRAGMLGMAPQKVTGSADLNISLDGFPRGTRTKTSASGLFREVRLNRGRLPAVNQGDV